MRHFQDLKMFGWEEDKYKFSKMESGMVLALKGGGGGELRTLGQRD